MILHPLQLAGGARQQLDRARSASPPLLEWSLRYRFHAVGSNQRHRSSKASRDNSFNLPAYAAVSEHRAHALPRHRAPGLNVDARRRAIV